MQGRVWAKRLVSIMPSKKFRNYLRDKFYLKSIPFDRYGIRYFKDCKEGNRTILETLQKGEPCLITRFGVSELKCVDYFWQNQNKIKLKFPKDVVNMMQNNAGFFNPSDEHLTRFCCDFLRLIPNIDVLGVTNFWGYTEKEILEQYNQKAELVEFCSIGNQPLFDDEPWTQYLEGKKVLVIHPFAEQIISQYKKRNKLFKNDKILPNFDLQVIKAVQGIGESEEIKDYETWFDALNNMYSQIDESDFDIALIGAGAYGIFLGDYIKRKGKQAVHIGGDTQILFGIKGSRWDNWRVGKELYNKYWVNVDKKYQPKSLNAFKKAEGNAAYW